MKSAQACFEQEYLNKQIISQERVLAAIRTERARQDEKWGVQNHHPMEWLVVLMEEVGEAAQAAVEMNWRDASPENYREELIQVAAVCVNAIECLDRNAAREGEVKRVGA